MSESDSMIEIDKMSVDQFAGAVSGAEPAPVNRS